MPGTGLGLGEPTWPATAPSGALPAPRGAASPSGTAATQVGEKWIEIVYSRPILRGRTDIFGNGADYGKKVLAGATMWRAGANVTTRLKTEVPLEIGGKKIAPPRSNLLGGPREPAPTLILSTHP